MMRPTCFLIFALSALGCGLAAADAVPPYTDSALEFEFTWNHERVGVDARAAKPSSVWWDPAAAKTVAHIQKQLDLLAQLSPRAWPVADWLKTARGAAFVVYPPLDATGPEPLALTMVTTTAPFDPMQVLPDAPPVTLGAFAGRGDMNRSVAAVLGPVAALGSGIALARVQESGAKRAADATSAPITLRLDLAAILGWIKRLEADGITYGLDPLLPGWRELAPVVTWTVRTDGGDWRGDGAITGISQSPLHPLAADMGALMTGGAQIRLAIGAEPRAIAGMMFNTMERAELEDFTALTGMRPDAVMELFTGDALLLANLKGPLPLGALVLKLRDHADPAPLVAVLAQKYRGEALPLEPLVQSAPGAKGGYVLNLPPGPVAVVWNAQRLVIASDQPMGLLLLAGTPGDAPVPAGVSVFAELDLPALAPNWLPLLYAGYANLKKPLAVDPLIGLRSVLPEMALALHQQGGQHGDQKLSALLKFPDELVYHRGDAATRFTPGTLGETATWISACFPGTDAAIGIDGAFTVYGLGDPSAGTTSLSGTLSLYRQADGFHVLEDERQGRSVALTPAAVTKRIKDGNPGAKKLFGPDFSALAMLPKRELPVLDRRWFIDQATLTRHLPRYRLLVRGTTDGAQVEEHGVPLAAIATAVGAYVLCTVEQPAMVRYHLGRAAAPALTPTTPEGESPSPTPTPPGVVEF